MGRIKSLMIKRAAKQLLDGENSFTDSFEHNKKLLKNTMPSKSTKNKVAGYIGHVIRMKREQAKKLAVPKANLEAQYGAAEQQF